MRDRIIELRRVRAGDLQPNDLLKVQVRGCKAGDPATMELDAKRVVAHPPAPES